MPDADRFLRTEVEPDEPRVLYRVDGPIAQVQLNRPTLLNAINADVHHGIVDGMQQRSRSTSAPDRRSFPPRQL
jgi:hypothetical protein